MASFFPGQGPSASPSPRSAALPRAATDRERPPLGGLPVVARVVLPGTELQLFPSDGHVPPLPPWSFPLCGPPLPLSLCRAPKVTDSALADLLA